MKITIASIKGLVLDSSIDYIVVQGDKGQLAILENHVPIVVPISKGFIKTVSNAKEEYFALSGAILEYNNNIINIITQEYAKGSTLELAKNALEEKRAHDKKENYRKMMDFTQMEKELALNLKEIKASKL